MKQGELPFKVLNGKPGYINLLDAFNSWQLVQELRKAPSPPAAASFKHVSPAGRCRCTTLGFTQKSLFRRGHRIVPDCHCLHPPAVRTACPPTAILSPFPMNVTSRRAFFLGLQVSDGIIAPSYSAKALEILGTAAGNYLVIQMDPSYEPPALEYKDVYMRNL